MLLVGFDKLVGPKIQRWATEQAWFPQFCVVTVDLEMKSDLKSHHVFVFVNISFPDFGWRVLLFFVSCLVHTRGFTKQIWETTDKNRLDWFFFFIIIIIISIRVHLGHLCVHVCVLPLGYIFCYVHKCQVDDAEASRFGILAHLILPKQRPCYRLVHSWFFTLVHWAGDRSPNIVRAFVSSSSSAIAGSRAVLDLEAETEMMFANHSDMPDWKSLNNHNKCILE